MTGFTRPPAVLLRLRRRLSRLGFVLLSELIAASGLFDFVRTEFPGLRAVLLKDSLDREELRELLEWAAGPARSARQLKITQGYGAI